MNQPATSAAAPLAPCVRCHSPIEEGDLRCAICALAVPMAARPIEASPQAQVLRCTECAAAVAFSAEDQAPRCAFCGATMKIEQPVDPIETARLRIPFTVDRATAEDALRGWLGKRGWTAPKALRDEAVFESLTPLGWAGWVVQARAAVTWTADSNEGRIHADWAPHSGEVVLDFHGICVPATRGLTPAECERLIPHYNMARAVPIDQRGPGEPAVLESFDAQRSYARVVAQRAIERFASSEVESHIPGTRFRNINVACLIQRQTTERVALPAWVLAYRYRGAPYRAIVHGETPQIVFGDAPTDWTKVMLVLLAVVAGIGGLIALLYLLG